MDKTIYWLQERVEHGEFRVFWAQSKINITDYLIEYHSLTHHRRLRPMHTYQENAQSVYKDVLKS